jgi:dTMP kinase
LLFAGDRFESKKQINEAVDHSDIVIFDRYVASNLAHQGARAGSNKRQATIEWLMKVEFEVFRLPAPDLTFYLDISVPLAEQLISRKKHRVYTDDQHDLHERDARYLGETRAAYNNLVEKSVGAGTWLRVRCESPEGLLRAPEEIHEEVWTSLRDAELWSSGRRQQANE